MLNFKRLMRLFVSRRRLVATAYAGAALAVTMQVLVPLLVRQVVDRAIAPGQRRLLLPLVAAFMAASALKAVGIFIRKTFAARAEVATETLLRAQLYDHIHALDMSYHEKMSTGQLMSRASSDLQQVGNVLGALPFFTAIFTYMVVVGVILLIVDLPLGAIVVCVLPVIAFTAVRFNRRLDPIVYATQQHLGELTAVAEETITGIRVVKAFGREPLQVDRFRTEADHVMHESLKSIRIRAFLNPLFEFLPSLTLTAIVLVGGSRVIQGSMSPGTFLLFSVYATQLVMPVRAAGWFAGDIQQMLTAVGRIFEVLDTEPGIADRQGAKPLDNPTGAVAFEHVTYRSGSGKSIVADVDLSVDPGTSVAFVGPTGCGKSTLLRLMLRFIEPTGGRVTIDGADIQDLTLHSLRMNTGTVFEDTFLFSDTIEANIAFGRPDASEEEIVEAAVLAQAHGFIAELPDGYQTVVGEQGYTLSGGQRQRIAIARAILLRPKILLLDDATSAVDPAVEELIRAGLSEAMRGKTTLMVARKPATAALADRVVYMEHGRVIAEGTHEQLWADLPAYRETISGPAIIGVHA